MNGNRGLLSKEDGQIALEFIQSCLSCLTTNDFSLFLETLKNLISCEFAIGVFVQAKPCALDVSCFVNPSYPSEWYRLYREKGFEKIDPVLREGRKARGLQYWTDSYKRYGGTREFVSYARDFRLKEGYSFALKACGRKRASLSSFGGETVERHPRAESILGYLVPRLHQAFCRLAQNSKELRRLRHLSFSTTEKEILKWAKDGTSLADISDRLRLSSESLLSSVNSLFSKLEAAHSDHAVALALERGVIEPD
jgi:DNA-binding CsgD family transcriptional regulator